MSRRGGVTAAAPAVERRRNSSSSSSRFGKEARNGDGFVFVRTKMCGTFLFCKISLVPFLFYKLYFIFAPYRLC